MRRSLWIGVFIFLLVACAQERPITGGDIDREGPVVQAIFPPNFSLNFSSPTIEVEFDEYIVLNDFQSQLIVSPPLTKRPDVQVKNKTLVLTFKEKLKDNTTYSFQFGEGIKDYTEGNIAQNIQIVMSTGAVMDSLSICGTLKSAYSTEPISGAKVMLYRGLADSLPQTQKPDYMSLTNEDGSFCVAYMSAGDYSLVAVQDEDANYLYDEGENMAFFSDRIQLSEASQTDSSLVLWASRERAKEIFISAYSIDSLGNMKMVFNESRVQPLLDVLESETDDYQVIYPNAADDTLRFWSTNPYLRNTEFRVEVQVDSVVLDTIYLLDNDEGLKTIQTDKTPAKRDWQRGIDFQFDHLLGAIDTSKINCYQDSISLGVQVRIDSSDSRKLVWDYNFEDGTNYSMRLLPGAIEGWRGGTNDSLKFDFMCPKANYYGTIKLELSLLEDLMNPVLLLLDEGGNEVTKIVNPEKSLLLQRLFPGKYSLLLFEDNNSDTFWTPGEYHSKTQPERTIHFPTELQIRSNWIEEYDWNLEK